MNKEYLSNMRKQEEDVVTFVIFRSINKICAIYPEKISLFRQQTDKTYKPIKLKEEFIEFFTWIGNKWLPIKVSYSDIACVVNYDLPKLSIILTKEDWKYHQRGIDETLNEFGENIGKMVHS